MYGTEIDLRAGASGPDRRTSRDAPECRKDGERETPAGAVGRRDDDRPDEDRPEARDLDAGRPEAERDRRLREIGACVARVAHELSTPLSVVVGSLDSLEQYVGVLVDDARGRDHSGPGPAGDRLAHVVGNSAELVSICRKSASRLSHALGQLSAYLRGHESETSTRSVDLQEVVLDALDLVRRQRGGAVEVVADLGGLPRVAGSPGAIGQALVNVIANAFDALEGRPGSVLHVLGLNCPAPPGRPAAERVVEVRIRDNGPGFPAEVRERAFEPFFTTKGKGAGLGLGLAIARDAMRSIGGDLRLGATGRSGAEIVLRLRAAP